MPVTTKQLDWLSGIGGHSAVHDVCAAVRERGRAVVRGSRGSSTNLLAGLLARELGQPILLVTAHLDEADDAIEDLLRFTELDPSFRAARFGALEVLPGESNVSLDLLAERLAVVSDLSKGNSPQVLIAPIAALMQPVPRPDELERFVFELRKGMELPPGALFNWLADCGYNRVDSIEQPGEFAARGGIIDIYPPAGVSTTTKGEIASATFDALGPIRLDYFGDEIESIASVDLDTMGSIAQLQTVRMLGASIDKIQSQENATNLLPLLSENTLIMLHEVLELTEQARGYFERLTDPRGIVPPNTLMQKMTGRPHLMVNQYSDAGGDDRIELPVSPLPSFAQDAAEAIKELAALGSEAGTTLVLCQKPAERDRLIELVREFAPQAQSCIRIEVGYLHRGFVWERREGKNQDSGPPSSISGPSLTLIPHHELFHRYHTRRRVRRLSTGKEAGDAFFDLNVGDYVVHVDHGIAQFTGLKTMKQKGVTQEYLTLEFAHRAVLNVPAAQIDLVQKYIGGFHGRPPLSTLGGKRWAKQKEQVAEAVKDLAAELLRVQAARQSMPGIRFPADTVWQSEFEAEFPYDETEDQLSAMASIKHDMSEEQPMDRLICGDVGFGKTELAIRAAFKAAEYGKQVAVLVPTTVLAEQHERTFRGRMADYPFRVESISRFKTGAEQKKTLQALNKGQVDIIIGTHRLLSEDVVFSDLGLVIIDEEQRFGVEHKNKLLQFRLTADVLTLTATPIPRTLHMSMLGLRDISSLTTAPLDRRAIVTEVVPYSEQRIKQAIIREMNRDGQVFFLHNRVFNIQSVADDIHRLVPDAKIVIGHGQMSARELEQVMLTFSRRQADVLVSTTIIESGIDIPTANTMIINQADHFGLADLHQLRGRVGRYKHRAYCYLLLPSDRPVTESAAKRLKAIEQYSMLGAGFKIAMRDLEIRGAGNLLGAEQSGHIAAVGYEMYCQLLDRATRRLKNQPIIEPSLTHLELPAAGQLPKKYVPSDRHRMEVYRRISRSASFDELAGVTHDMVDAYGQAPPKAQQLVDLAEIRIAASHLGIERIKLEGPDLIFTVSKAARLENVFADAPGRITVIDERTLYWRPLANYIEAIDTLLAVLRKLLVRPVQLLDAPASATAQ